jgi:hypothetical protein
MLISTRESDKREFLNDESLGSKADQKSTKGWRLKKQPTTEHPVDLFETVERFELVTLVKCIDVRVLYRCTRALNEMTNIFRDSTTCWARAQTIRTFRQGKRKLFIKKLPVARFGGRNVCCLSRCARTFPSVKKWYRYLILLITIFPLMLHLSTCCRS